MPVSQDKQRHGYLRTALALSPMAVIKGVIDIPEGAVDQVVHGAAAGNKITRRSFWEAVKERGAARGLAHVPTAIATAPIYFSGIKDLKSDDRQRRRRGAAKVALSGGLLGLGKGTTEAALEAASKGGTAALKSLKGSFGRVGLTRMGFGIGGGLLIAREIAGGEKARDKGNATITQKYIRPGLAGAAAGAVKGGTEYAIKDFSKLKQLGFRKGILAPAAGRAAAGFIGGAVLGELVHKFKNKFDGHEKTSALLKIADEEPSQEPQIQIPGMKPGVHPYRHQKRAIEKLIANNGTLVMAHGVGSGKTETAIMGEMTLRALGKSQGALVIVPAGLRGNFADRVKKRTNASVQIIGPRNEKGSVSVDSVQPGKDFYVIGYELFRQHPEIVQQLRPSTLILDEYHKVRNPAGSTYDAIMSIRPQVRNFIGMTGSIVNNDPADIAPLVSLAAGNRFMTQAQFKRIFERKVAREAGFFGGTKYIVGMQNIPHLQRQIGPYVDYISSEEAAGSKMPRRNVQTIETPMSKEQEEYYRYVLKQLNPITAWKIRNNVAPSDHELNTVFQQLMKARQVSNSLHTIDRNITPQQASFLTPKVNKLLQDTQEHLRNTPDGQVVIYSNLVHGGADVIAAGLKARGIPFGVFMGKDREVEGFKSSEEGRAKAVSDYQSGKIKVILITGAGAEGLDLKNTTMVQTLDGHFNPERILQAEARGRRIGGLMHRAPEHREVQVKRYVSTLERSMFDKILGRKETSVDQYIYNVAGRKTGLNKQLIHALQTIPQQRLPRLEQVLEQAPKQRPANAISPPDGSHSTLTAGPIEQPTFRSPPGVELPKKLDAKYVHRYRTPGGKIIYRYEQPRVNS